MNTKHVQQLAIASAAAVFGYVAFKTYQKTNDMTAALAAPIGQGLARVQQFLNGSHRTHIPHGGLFLDARYINADFVINPSWATSIVQANADFVTILATITDADGRIKAAYRPFIDNVIYKKDL